MPRPHLPRYGRAEYDVQQRRLYRAAWAVKTKPTRIGTTLKDAAEFVAKILRSRWFRERFGGGWTIHVRRSRAWERRGWGYAYLGDGPRDGGMVIPRSQQTDEMILHELAHLLTKRARQSHGALYAGVYLALLERFGTPGFAEETRRLFRKRGVAVRRPRRRI